VNLSVKAGNGPDGPDRPDGWPVKAADRAALLRKYRVLAKWRRARDARADRQGQLPSHLDRAALRALSSEFPGALRELDVLGLPEILRRIKCLMRPADRRAEEKDAWIAWIAAYHGMMRAALIAKRTSGRARRLAADAMPAIVRATTMAAGVPIDDGFLLAVARPRGGRLAVVVLDALSARFNVPATLISTTLFPIRRPSPYGLSS
jgi:hypothetical protein